MKSIKILFISILSFVLLLTSSCDSREIYKVTYRDYDDSIIKQEEVLVNKPSTPPSNPVRDGYIFIGWSEDVSKIEKDLTVYAQYAKKLIGLDEAVELFLELDCFSYLIDNSFLDEAGITDYVGIFVAEEKDYSDFIIGICFKNSVFTNINNDKGMEFLKQVVKLDKPEYIDEVVYIKEQQWIYVGTEEMINIFKK